MAYIPYGKRSKKEQRKQDLSRRNTWDVKSPVTKRIPSLKTYNRKKAHRQLLDPQAMGFLIA